MYCEDCYNEHTFSCDCCGALVHDNDVYWRGDYPYCSDCYEDEENDSFIHDYSFKPDPIFYKCSDEENIRYYGVELEIDYA